jgi:GNAT superfamily N-acetyltransferase
MYSPYEILPQSERDDYASFVARVDDTCAGEVRITHALGSAYLDRIHVARDYRAAGIGRALLLRAEEWATLRGALSILAVLSPDSSRDMETLSAFFERNGYRVNHQFSAVKVLRS